jgi:hypothetical protein
MDLMQGNFKISAIMSPKHDNRVFPKSQNREMQNHNKKEKIRTIGIRRDLDHHSGPMDMMQENIRILAIGSPNLEGNYFPKSQNHEKKE